MDRQDFEKEIERIYLEDKDTKHVTVVQMSLEDAKRDCIIGETEILGIPVYIRHVFLNGYVMVDYCVRYEDFKFDDERVN